MKQWISEHKGIWLNPLTALAALVIGLGMIIAAAVWPILTTVLSYIVVQEIASVVGGSPEMIAMFAVLSSLILMVSPAFLLDRH
jgi:hypothetical protein